MKKSNEKQNNKFKKNLKNQNKEEQVIVLWIAAAIGAAASIAGAIISANQTKKNNRENIRNQQEMWDLTNEYNNPINQRLRMEAAGFNPNLMAGSPVNTASNQNMPDLKTPDYTGISNAGNIFAEQYYKGLQTEADILKKDSETNLNIQKHDIGKEELDILKGTKSAQISSRYENLEKLRTQNKINQIGLYVADQTKATKIATEYQKLQNIKMQHVLMGKQAHGVDLENDVKQFRSNLAKQGIDPNGSDVKQLLQFLFGTPAEWLYKQGQKYGKSKVEQWYNEQLTPIKP